MFSGGILRRHLPVHKNNMQNLFKVSNKDSRTTSMTSFWRVFIVNFEEISHIVLVFPLLILAGKCQLGKKRRMAWNGLAALHCLKTFMKASFYHIEIIQLICRAKQVTSFYIRGRCHYNIFGSIVRKHREYLYLTFSCFLELGLNK